MIDLMATYECAGHSYRVAGWIESVVYLYGGPIECVEAELFRTFFTRVS